MWFVLIHGLKFYDDRIEFIKFIFKKQPVLLSDIAMVELRLERVLLGNCMTILVTLKDGSRLERCHELINGKKVSAFMLRRFEDAFAKMARPGDASEVELHLHFDDNVDQVSIKLNSLPIHDDGTYTLKAKVGDYISFASKKSVFFFPIVDGTHTEFLIRMNNPYLSVRMTTKEGV